MVGTLDILRKPSRKPGESVVLHSCTQKFFTFTEPFSLLRDKMGTLNCYYNLQHVGWKGDCNPKAAELDKI